jgi:hypothetical protein
VTVKCSTNIEKKQRTTTSHIKSLNNKNITWYGVGNPGHGFGQALKSDDLILQLLKHVDCCNEIHKKNITWYGVGNPGYGFEQALKSDDLIVQPLKHVDCCNEIHRQLTICFYWILCINISLWSVRFRWHVVFSWLGNR